MIDKNSVASALLYASRSNDYSNIRGRGAEVADVAKANPVATKNLIQDVHTNRSAIQDKIELSPAAIDAMRNKAENSGAAERVRTAMSSSGHVDDWDIPTYHEALRNSDALFNFLDGDGDGQIKLSEIKDGLKAADRHMNDKEILKIAANAYYVMETMGGADNAISRAEFNSALYVGYHNEFGPDLVDKVIASGVSKQEAVAMIEEAKENNTFDEIMAFLMGKMREEGGSEGSFNVGDGNTNVEGSGSAANGTGASINPAGDAFWSQFDTDESGFVTQEEFEAWLSATDNPNVAPEELQGLKAEAQELWDNLLADIAENGLSEEGQPENSVSFAQYQDWLATFGPQPPEPGVEVGDSGGTGEEGGESELIES